MKVLDSFSEITRRMEVAAKTPSCIEEICGFVDELFECCEPGGFSEYGVEETIRLRLYTRAATALNTLFCSLSTGVNLSQLRLLSFRKQTITYLYWASGFRGTLHMIGLLGERDEQENIVIPPERKLLLFSLLSIDHISDELRSAIFELSDEVFFYLSLGFLNQRAVLTTQGEKNRTAFLAAGHRYNSLRTSNHDFPLIINAWMYTSYASVPTKHAIKAHLNNLLSDVLQQVEVPPVQIKEVEPSGKETVVVILERYRKEHAMYRCYAPLIGALKSRFNVVAVAEEGQIELEESSVDTVIQLPKPIPAISDIAKQISQCGPAMVYYPSLGMSHWTVLLAQLRLAPVQVMSLGHPATSHIPTIDYVYTAHMEGNLADVFSETVLVGADTGCFAAHTSLSFPAVIGDEVDSKTIKVAVNSKVMKISYRLINILREIRARSSMQVEYVFFPGERNLYYDGLAAMLVEQLGEVEVVNSYAHYDSFILAN